MPSHRTFKIMTRHGRVALTDKGGDRLPIIYIHGSGSSRGVFEKQMRDPRLDDWRQISIDLLGHGESDNAINPGEAYTVVGLADAVTDVVAGLGIKRYVVCGWSLGGHVAIEMLGRVHGSLGTVVVGAPPISKGIFGMLRGFHPSFDLLLASKPVFSPRDVDRFLSLCFSDTATLEFREALVRADGRLRAVFSGGMMKGVGRDQRDVVENSETPVAFINGASDPFLRASFLSALRVQTQFRQRPQFIEGAGHAPFWEKSQDFNSLLEAFLEDVETHEALRRDASKPKILATGRS